MNNKENKLLTLMQKIKNYKRDLEMLVKSKWISLKNNLMR